MSLPHETTAETVPAGRAPTSQPGTRVRLSAATAAAGLLATVLTALGIWWPLAQGAYFPVVYLPGAVLLYATLAVLLITAPLPISRRGAHVVAIAALTGLAIWTAISIAWTPARDLALEDAQRTLIYPAAFFAGLWLSTLLRRQPALAVAPFLIAVTVVTLATVVAVISANSAASVLDVEETLFFPFDYRNANAAFFVVSALVMVAVVGRRPGPVALRAGAASVGVACLCLAILSQSRGSLIAAAVGVLVLLATSRERWSTLVGLLIVCAPALVLLPQLLDPFAAEDRQLAFSELQQVGRLIPFAALAGAVVAALFGLVQGKLPQRLPSERTGRRRARNALASLALLAVLATAGVLAIGGVPDLSDNDSADPGNRFTYTGDLNRSNFWEVALEQFKENPLAGEGSGSFRTRYALDRTTAELPRDAHSLEFETLGELGLVGLGLLLIGTFAVGVGVIKSRSHGPDEAFLASAALAATAAWITQGSVDWFTSIPGLTAPVLGLLGVAAGPAAYSRSRRLSLRVRLLPVLALILVLAALIPHFISERLTFDSARGWRDDPQAALDALQRAADLNPLADAPLLVEAEIARQVDQPERALVALAEAERRQPSEWLIPYQQARLLAKENPDAARERLRRALDLNPLEPDLAELRRRLQSEAQSPEG